MVSFKKPNLDSFQERIHIATLFVTFCFLLLITRLVWLQLVSHGKYALLAESNRIALVPAPANRGLLIDRNGIVIGRNYSALTLDVNAEEVKGNVDQLINDLSEIVAISPRDRRNFKRSLEDSRNMGTSPCAPCSTRPKLPGLWPIAIAFLGWKSELEALESIPTTN